MKPLLLDGIRVIDLTVSFAGPKAVACLADMGAEVIKVESVQYIDAQRGRKTVPSGMRSYPNGEPGERPWNRHAGFNQLNRNKLGITVDLTRPQGKEIFKRLVKISDVVVDSFSAGVMERLGLGYAQLKEIRPDIVVMSMPGLGMTGPYRGYKSFGGIVECIAGQVAVKGYPDGKPFTTGAYGDPIGGLHGAIALLIAFLYRQRTGKGQFIDLSQAESLAVLSAEAIMDYTMNGRVQKPMGNRHRFMAPHGTYRCKGEDKWVAIAVSSDEEWQALCKAAGRLDWANDVKFSTALSRWLNAGELDRSIQEWTVHLDHYEVMNVLQAAGVAAGAVLTADEAFHDPHLEKRGFFEIVSHPEAGTHLTSGISWKLSKTPACVRFAAPCLGQHNQYVLHELLGISYEEIAQLEAEQIIGTEPLETAVA